jgi:hypothetical protein
VLIKKKKEPLVPKHPMWFSWVLCQKEKGTFAYVAIDHECHRRQNSKTTYHYFPLKYSTFLFLTVKYIEIK